MGLKVEVDSGGISVGFFQPLKAAAEATLQEHTVEEAALTIKLIDEEQMRALNHSFAGIDRPTDVLAFPSGEPDPDSGMAYLGDVVLCPTIAMGAAAERSHSLRDELTLLTVHGVLHLLGYDHERAASKRDMWAVQSRVLERLGCPARPD